MAASFLVSVSDSIEGKILCFLVFQLFQLDQIPTL